MVVGHDVGESERTAFERDGYLIFDPGLPAKVLDEAVTDVEQGPRRRRPPFARQGPLGNGERAPDAWAVSPSVKQIALAPAVLELLRTLYGREPRPFQTLNFRPGTQQRTHADAVHTDTEPPELMCGVWVALEDVDMDCGPLVYYPGSHKLAQVTPTDVGLPSTPVRRPS